ncbi:MAG: DUF6266 family protein [Bacteroidales bacterium]|jgi:hypothetical protein|nr:DUF6266 family protein [Bacteroidales bacterium]
MGQINQGILGGFSGKVGTVVGSSWKNINYMRSLPRKSKKPASLLQLQQQRKLATVINFLKPMTPLLRQGWKHYTKGRSAFNAATAHTIFSAISGEYPNYEINYEKVVISVGHLTPVEEPEVKINDGRLQVSWQDNSGTGNAQEKDKLLLAVINPDKSENMLVYDHVARVEAGFECSVSHWAGDTIHIYIGFISEDGKRVATSRAICNVTVPN